MPEMDGFEATQLIRSARKKPQPLIVALTASALNHERERCKAVGMDHFLTKPIKPKDIEGILMMAIDCRGEGMDFRSGYCCK